MIQNDAKKQSVAGGWWVRADRYELVDGVIRPHPEAQFDRFDPWRSYRSAMQRPRRKTTVGDLDTGGRKPSGRDIEESLYQPLLSLTTKLERANEDGDRSALSPGLEDELLTWCSRFGLLGVLPHQVQAVMFPPRWQSVEGHRRLEAISDVYERGSAGWRQRDELLGLKASKPAVVNVQVDADLLARLRRRPRLSRSLRPTVDSPGKYGLGFSTGALTPLLNGGGVLLRSLHDATLEVADLDDPAVAAYFSGRDTDDAGGWPHHGFEEEAFWRAYGEPLPDFLAAAQILVRALDAMAAARSEMFHGDRQAALEAAWRNLNDLTVDSPQAGRVDADGTVTLGYATPSLLASLALMLQKDLGDGATISRCAFCGTPVVSGIKWTAYCSTTCRWSDQKARQRRRKREALSLAAEGHSPMEIAERVEAKDVETVRRWIAAAPQKRRTDNTS